MTTLYNFRREPPKHATLHRMVRTTAPASAFDTALQFTIGYGVPGYGAEGGEADDPSDPGGFTWRGITLSTYRDWIGDQSFTSTQLLQLSEDEIVAFYGSDFWNAVAGNQLPPAIAVPVFDFAVNAGQRQSGRTLQQAVGTAQDGSIGPVTLAAVAGFNQAFLLGHFTALRLAFYEALNMPQFIEGWTNRANDCETAAQVLLPETHAHLGV